MMQQLNEFDFHQRISETAGIALVFFTGPHCSSCHHLRSMLLAEQARFKARLEPFSVFEIAADKSMALVNEFAVFHLPSLYLYRDGRFHCELHAEANPPALLGAIEEALLKPPQEEP